MNLILFTNFFPHKKAEPFLVNEFEYTKANFNTICILSMYGKKEDAIFKSDSKITVLNSVFEDHKNKKQIFTKGIFNISPFGFHLKEFFKQTLFLQPKKAYWFFVSFCIVRSTLASKGYKDIIETINSSQNTILYFYWGDNLTWIIPYLKKDTKNKNVKIIIRLHGSDLYEGVKNNYAPLRNYILKDADHVITVSENGKNYLQSKYPNYANKISVGRLGVFDNGLNPFIKNKIITIVSVSNAIALKRVHLIFEILQKSKHTINWHHFGDGILMPNLKELIKQKRTGLFVQLHGSVSNQTIIDFYKNKSVNLFINVSATEGVPVSIMEALSFGIPVFATNVGGTAELVNNNVGLLLDVNFDINTTCKQLDNFIEANESDTNTFRINAQKQFVALANAENNYTAFYNDIKEGL